MVSGAVSGVAVKVSSPSQVGCPFTHTVPVPGVTDPTLWTVTAISLGRMVTVMVKVTVPPLGATVIGTAVGDPVPVKGFAGGDPHVDPVLGVHVQDAPAASSGGSGSMSENVPEPVALSPGLVTVTVYVNRWPGTGWGSVGACVFATPSRAGLMKLASAWQVAWPLAHSVLRPGVAVAVLVTRVPS